MLWVFAGQEFQFYVLGELERRGEVLVVRVSGRGFRFCSCALRIHCVFGGTKFRSFWFFRQG